MTKSRIFSFGLAVFLFAWLVTNHFRPWLAFHSELLALLALVCMFVSRLIDESVVAIPRISYWVAFAGFLPLLQYDIPINIFAGDILLACFYLFALFMAIIIGYVPFTANNSANTISRWIHIAHAVWIAALLSAMIGLVQWLNLADGLGIWAMQTDIGARAAGNLGQPNQLATLLLMGIVALIYVFEHKVIGKNTLAIAVAFMTFVLVLTQSRAGMISVLVIAAFLLWKQRLGNLLLSTQAVLWWVGGFALATFSLPTLSEWLLMGGSRGLMETGSISERWLIWKQVVYAIGQAPWLGYGWNQTPTANAMGALAYPGSTTYTNAHNIVLDLMDLCDIPLVLFFTAVIA
jgi:O-antigen ligase